VKQIFLVNGPRGWSKLAADLRKEDSMTLKLDHLHLRTRNPETKVRFYVDNLRVKVVSQSPVGVDGGSTRVRWREW